MTDSKLLLEMLNAEHDERHQIVQYLTNYYQETHCIKHHDCRQSSRIISSAIQVLTNEPLDDLTTCDCYECAL